MRMRALAGLPVLTAVSISALTAGTSMVAGSGVVLRRLTQGLLFGAGVGFGAGFGFAFVTGGGVLPLSTRPLMKSRPSHFLSLARLPPLPSGRVWAWKFEAAGLERGMTLGFGLVLGDGVLGDGWRGVWVGR
ncbi:hypothetical protein BBK82_31825 [Lentzea guizhouensis]|uniref:Uncharacterized protein n=1 Tax=Lentzea guizhouensis TaxID=1586287 RepID=A0A1B2HQI8_9PSEU|nr:hypothetical protein BBK82_31825 [Lentzea guizhouensis]